MSLTSNKYFRKLAADKRLFFIGALCVSIGYLVLFKSELYESRTALIVKEINKQSVATMDLSILGSGVSSQMEDSKTLETYLLSWDVLQELEAKFGLREHYASFEVDMIDRLGPWATDEDFLRLYQKRLNIFYDEISGIMHVGFSHTQPETAQAVVDFLIERAETQLNTYTRRNALKQLEFIEVLVTKNRDVMDESISRLEAYQNRNLVLDPTTDAQSNSSIIAGLEAALVQKRSELNQLKRYMNESSFEIIRLKNEIDETERSLVRARAKLSGGDESQLNAILFEFEKLKNRVEFDKEVYKQSLLQLEAARIDVNKQAKVLTVLTRPTLPDGYTYPNKFRDSVTLLILFMLVYGIGSLVVSIIKDHRD